MTQHIHEQKTHSEQQSTV